MSQNDEQLRDFLRAEQQVELPDLEARRAAGWDRLIHEMTRTAPNTGDGGSEGTDLTEPSGILELGRWIPALTGTLLGLGIGFGLGVQYTAPVDLPPREITVSDGGVGEGPSVAEDTGQSDDGESETPNAPSDVEPEQPTRRPRFRSRHDVHGTSSDRGLETPSAEVLNAEASMDPAPEAEAPLDTLGEELVIARARVALQRGLLRDCLRAVANHERRFPNGALREERERLAISALSRQGRSQLARRRADTFLRDFPVSIHRTAVEAIRSGLDRE